MEKQKAVKIASVVLAVILVVNMALFAAKKISVLLFWLIIVVIGILAWKAIPKIH